MNPANNLLSSCTITPVTAHQSLEAKKRQIPKHIKTSLKGRWFNPKKFSKTKHYNTGIGLWAENQKNISGECMAKHSIKQGSLYEQQTSQWKSVSTQTMQIATYTRKGALKCHLRCNFSFVAYNNGQVKMHLTAKRTADASRRIVYTLEMSDSKEGIQ